MQVEPGSAVQYLKYHMGLLSIDSLRSFADKKVDVFEEGHGPEDVLPNLAQKAIRIAQEKGEADTAEIQALIQHEVDFMQVSAILVLKADIQFSAARAITIERCQ